MATDTNQLCPVSDAIDLESLAATAAQSLELCSAEEILRWAYSEFPGSFALTSSMADTVVVHLASKIIPGVPVIFLDTGFHFDETIQTVERVRDAYDVDVRIIVPEMTVTEQAVSFGPNLFERNPDLCCDLRKVRPLDGALEPFDAWGSGLRRDDAPQRRSTSVVEWDSRRSKVKVNPIARWTDADVAEYIDHNQVIMNPLTDEGYPSIGCATCTRRVPLGADPRSGRWAGLNKIECGIHTATGEH